MKKNLPCPILSPVLWAKGWDSTNFKEQIHAVRNLVYEGSPEGGCLAPGRDQCNPSGALTCFGGFLNSHAAAAQTSASTAVQRKTSIYASIAACWISLP